MSPTRLQEIEKKKNSRGGDSRGMESFFTWSQLSPLHIYTASTNTAFSRLILLLSFLFFTLLTIVAIFLDYIKKIGLIHTNPHTTTDMFLDDPNSIRKIPLPSVFDPAERYISLIIPAYNEEHRLHSALTETMNYLQQRVASDDSFSYEVVIIDDGSTDRTSKVAFDFVRRYTIDKIRVIQLGTNRGKGEAVRYGMLHSRGNLLLMLDADGATKITDLEKLESKIAALAKKQVESALHDDWNLEMSETLVAAFGSRAHLEKEALATRKWYRNFLMKGFHLVVLLTAGPAIRDTQCGFKMFTRGAARKLFRNMRLKRWCFDVELVYLCKHLNIPMVEVSVNWSEIPGSKIGMTSIIYMLFEMLLIRLGYSLGLWKIYT